MQRRTVIASGLAAPFVWRLLGPPSARAAEPGGSETWRHFEITTRISLVDAPGSAQLWLPVAQTATGYQRSADLRWQTDGQAELVYDDRYGAGILRSIWPAETNTQQIEVVQTVATRDRGPLGLAPLTSAETAFWTAPSETVPTDGIVHETAEKLTAGATTPRERLRAIYDWVVDTTWRNPDTPGCGTGDYKTMLQTGFFGGKCADINGLMVGLARAAGFPARDVYGIRVADSSQFPSLGKSGDISKAQHCRAEVFLPDTGWFPVDPADVRKVVLEQKLPVDSPQVRTLRERLFGSWEMNWIGYNSASDINLPGATNKTPNFTFLMYPCAFTSAGQPDCLDPQNFKYQITSRELPA